MQIGLISKLPSLRHINSAQRRWILCPWLARFPPGTGIWLGVLAAHDANGALLRALPVCRRSRLDLYAAVFAADPFRSAEEIIHRVEHSAAAGVINFPSITFIDGAAAATFEKLSLGVNREIEFLAACSAAGLRIAGVVRTAAAAERLLGLGADFLVAHGGPPTAAERDPSLEAAHRIATSVGARNVPIVPLSFITRPPRRAAKRVSLCPALVKN